MTRVGLLSDTHSFLDERIFDHFKTCDEVWHAGDFGANIAKQLKIKSKILRGVYGNIDEHEIRHEFPEQLVFNCEQVKVM